MISPIRVGAVIYDPKVVVIWEIIKEFFGGQGVPMDCVFYTNYELMVEGCRPGTSISPGTRRWPGWTHSGEPAAPAVQSPCATRIATASPTWWCAATAG